MKSKPEKLPSLLKKTLSGKFTEFIFYIQDLMFSVNKNISIFVYARVEDFPGKRGSPFFVCYSHKV